MDRGHRGSDNRADATCLTMLWTLRATKLSNRSELNSIVLATWRCIYFLDDSRKGSRPWQMQMRLEEQFVEITSQDLLRSLLRAASCHFTGRLMIPRRNSPQWIRSRLLRYPSKSLLVSLWRCNRIRQAHGMWVAALASKLRRSTVRGQGQQSEMLYTRMIAICNKTFQLQHICTEWKLWRVTTNFFFFLHKTPLGLGTCRRLLWAWSAVKGTP